MQNYGRFINNSIILHSAFSILHLRNPFPRTKAMEKEIMYFFQNWWQFLILAIVCYLIGCFNFAVLISKLKKKNITKMGSGNPGTMNMTREFGVKVGIITFFCDAFKAGIPALIVHFVYTD